MEFQPYAPRYGGASEDLGRHIVPARDHPSTNPYTPYFGRPLSLEEHQV